MIKKFPDFTKLDLQHRDAVERVTTKFEPYSDFNFTSLYCWSDGNTRVSLLNDNLVISLPDYINSDNLVFSILGSNKIDESILELLRVTDELELIPEVVIQSIKHKDRFKIKEDRDQFDYVYPLPEQAGFEGSQFKGKRKLLNRFIGKHGEYLSIRKINFRNKADRSLVEKMFHNWAKNRKREKQEILNEYKALDKLLENSSHFQLIGILVFVKNECVGFTINEIIHKDYAICHFQKSILSFEHIDVFLSNLVAKELKHFGSKYVNWEQDLGIEGLRSAKLSYRPVHLLKKYRVSSVS